MTKLLLRATLTALTASLLCSCASITVKDTAVTRETKPKAAPKKFYVTTFSTQHATLKEHPLRKHPGQLGPEAQELLAKYLVAELSKSIAPAVLVKSPAAAGANGWLITGDFTRISEGSRILRMAIGLGMGGTKMETNVTVQNLPARSKPFMRFSTTGGSGASPGGATSPVPFSGTAAALFASSQGVSDDSARTARMITARIADYMIAHRWLAQGNLQKAKMAKEPTR